VQVFPFDFNVGLGYIGTLIEAFAMIHEMQDVKTDGILHHQHFPIAHKAQL
jgi:hypothetical protein